MLIKPSVYTFKKITLYNLKRYDFLFVNHTSRKLDKTDQLIQFVLKNENRKNNCSRKKFQGSKSTGNIENGFIVL